ncbi:MAG: asparaginase [Dehalococcoidia bacterium]|nr:asparaginase [Dehalococcoidia bacterium]MDP6228246.1 asparaginase [Dehalococcoidia bacterium]MDP7084951.1 asparaginase [Dehalococcoidia bacterium]MDP7199993.1 asparaginase [Dehalococcoidia bacterium]MDP7511016.1 asparaginase [Dehalococcoidia bacterium]
MTNSPPVVRVIGTGGSISGIGPHRLDYTLYGELGKKLLVGESLARIPELAEIAQVRSEDLISVGSTAFGPQEWLPLSQRINQIFRDEDDVAGVVVTHGTATLEETAYFLHLTVKSSKPVVITGAMRPPTAMGTDADVNLLDAVRIAACPEAVGLGVLTVLNNEVQCARDVVKANTYRVETFRPNELGFLGYADSDGQVVFYRAPLRKHTMATPFDVGSVSALPRVDIVYAYAGADGLLVEAARNNKSDGLVIAGLGSGGSPPALEAAASDAALHGMPVVLASRVTAGRVILTPKKEKQGIMVADNLLPQKARILLMLGLTITSDRGELQQMFWEY